MMKKTFKLFTLLLLLFAVGFTACNNNKNKESKEKEENTEANIQVETKLLKTDIYNDTINGVHIIVKYNIENKYFSGSLENITDKLIEDAKVWVQLSNGMELNPSPETDLKPGQEVTLVIDAEVKEWEKWATHLEIGNSEGRE